MIKKRRRNNMSNKTITAKEAAQLSEKGEKKRLEEAFVKIMDMIKFHATMGKKSMFEPSYNVSHDIVLKLEALGYTIEDRNKAFVLIKW
jgi:hypothetical protein